METIEIQIRGNTIRVPLSRDKLDDLLDQLNDATTVVEEEIAFLVSGASLRR